MTTNEKKILNLLILLMQEVEADFHNSKKLGRRDKVTELIKKARILQGSITTETRGGV